MERAAPARGRRLRPVCWPTSRRCAGPSRPTAGNADVWHLYVVRVAERDRVLAALHEAGVGAGIHYPTPVHLTRAYADLGLAAGSFPVAEAAADEILSLPIFPHLTPGAAGARRRGAGRAVAEGTR